MAMDRVKVLPWPGIERAYLCLSGKRRRKQRVGDYWYGDDKHTEHREKYGDLDTRTEPVITFLYDAGDVCAEWDGSYGPIKLWFRQKPEYSSEYDKGRAHWFYDFAYGDGCWSQMAVDEAGLPEAFARGDFESIFRELKSWADSRQAEVA